MREPYWHDKTATLYVGDPREVLSEMADSSVDCIVTSPPPYTPHQSTAPGQQPPHRYGNEPTPALYIAALRRVFAEAHRVLHDEGTAWLITSDRYAAQTGRPGPPPAGRHSRAIRDQAMTGVPAASLIGLPWQLAFALHDDGWIIRNAIVWHHPSAADVPTDRYPRSYELIFLLAKQNQYYFDPDAAERRVDHAIAVPGLGSTAHGDPGICVDICSRGSQESTWHDRRRGSRRRGSAGSNCRGRSGPAHVPNERHDPEALPLAIAADVWALLARPQRHTMPIEVPPRCVAAGCRPGGTVLGMFSGTGVGGLAARRLDRSFVGVEATAELGRIAVRTFRGEAGPR